jgi:hypothetical protein
MHDEFLNQRHGTFFFIALFLMAFYLLLRYLILFLSRVQMKSWAGKALETVNCCAFLKRRLIGAR